MTLRQRARSAAVDPNHWFPACWSHELKSEDVREASFSGTSYAVFRGEDGVARTLRNQCAHRPVPLALGHVERNELVCPYHGWSYDGCGQLVQIRHSLFGKKKPKLCIPSLPTIERYGLVWFFPGDASRAARTALPEIGPLDLERPWPSIGMDEVWSAHHSAVIDNVLDLSHAHLHRRFEPFVNPELEHLEVDPDAVHARYRTAVGASPMLRPFLPKDAELSRMTMSYVYPHHCSNTGDYVRHWTLLRPVDDRTTHVYVIFAAKSARIPGTPWTFAPAVMKQALHVLARLYIRPLLREDRDVLEAEQRLQEQNPGVASPELNPVVRACHRLTVRKAPVRESKAPCAA